MRALLLLLGLSGAAAVNAPLFVDVTQKSGIVWSHFNGQSDDRFLVETTTGGIGFLDFDGDGRMDLLLVNGGQTPHGRSPQPVRNALYRNTGNGKWEDVTVRAGLARTSVYGMGVAVGDYDNDGRPDVYLTGYPASALFHNKGDGTFEDVTSKATVGNNGEWGSSAAWFDYDRDGRLDLFVANYAAFSYDDRRQCAFAGKPAYCAQTAYQGRPPKLYHNEGDGTFKDATASAGLDQYSGRALGVVALDLNGDHWQDLFVARDASPNLLLLNQQNGKFVDASMEAETAYNADGVARAGMGVDAGDVNGDGLPDLAVTNFDSEYHALYLGQPRLPYREATVSSHLAAHTKNYVGWGIRFLDFDNDGDQDLFIVNGHLHELIAQTNKSVSYREPPLLLANNGAGIFENAGTGPVFQTSYLGRGLATADFDNDGAVDAAFISLQAPPVLLRNTAAAGRHWLGIHLRGTRSNRDGIGAKLTLQVGNQRLTRWIAGGGSFLAAHDLRVVFGLNDRTQAGPLEILWPSGIRQTLNALTPDRYHTITEPTQESAASALSPGNAGQL